MQLMKAEGAMSKNTQKTEESTDRRSNADSAGGSVLFTEALPG